MWSFPNERVILTRHANPRAASQVPKVRMIIIRNILMPDVKFDLIIIRIKRFKIIASRARRVVRRWVR